MSENYDALKIDNQICFPLYAASREIIKRYRTVLHELDLTYTQYIVMMILWEKNCCSVKELGEKLYLDSGTLTPVLKSLQKKEYVKRFRSKEDERVLIAQLTDSGLALREKAMCVPGKMASCMKLEPEEVRTLYKLLYKVINSPESDN